MKLKRGIIILMAALMLLCTMPEIALADEVIEPAPSVENAAPEEEEAVPAASESEPEAAEPAPEAADPESDADPEPEADTETAQRSIIPAISDPVVLEESADHQSDEDDVAPDVDAIEEQTAQSESLEVTVTIHVQTSRGDNLEGVHLTGGPAGGYVSHLGDTDENGELKLNLAPGLYNFTANYDYSTQTMDVEVDENNTTIQFETSEVRIKVVDSSGAALEGVKLQYQAGGYPHHFGVETGTDGVAVRELFAGTYEFSASYKGMYTDFIDVDISKTGVDHTFTATLVTLDYPGTIRYKGSNGDMYDFNKPSMLMFPGTYEFTFSGSGGPTVTRELTIGDSPVNNRIGIVSLKDSTGQGLEGGEVSYYAGGWVNNAFETNSDGYALLQVPADKNVTNVAVNYQGGRNQINEKLSSNPIYEFQTKKVTFELIDSEGNDLVGETEYYGDAWKKFGNGSTGSTMELLPGSYVFRVSYQGASIQKTQNISTDPDVEFNTVPVSFKLLSSEGEELDGEAEFHSKGWKSFGNGRTGSTMELLPTTYSFRVKYLDAGVQKSQNVGADPNVEFNTVSVSFKLLSSEGEELDGEAEFHSNGWKPFGDGATNTSIEMLPAKYSFRVTYDGASQKKENVQISEEEAEVVFQTGAVIFHYAGGTLSYYSGGWKAYDGPIERLPVDTQFRLQRSGWPTQWFKITPAAGQVYEKTLAYIRLVDSEGSGIEGGTVSYYDRGWKTLGNTDSDGAYFEMLDGKKVRTLSFKMALDVGSHQLSQSMATDSFVLFQTKKVTFKLIDSEGNDLVGEAEYNGGSWKEFGNGKTGSSMELFPGSYSFRVGYQGVSIQKSQNIGTDPDVVFQTVPVTFTLKSSTGEPIEGEAYFRTGKWKPFGDGSTGSTMELLPTTYSFKVKYLDAGVQKSQNVGADPNVEFNTVSVSFKLLSSEGEELDGEAEFYSNGWKSFGDGANTSMEMLPEEYSFRVTYDGASQKKENVQISEEEAEVVFQTGAVIFHYAGGTLSYYSGGWKAYDGPIERLPVDTQFRLQRSGWPTQWFKITPAAGQVYEKTLAYIRLVDSEGAGIEGGTVSYYDGGWKTLGNTDSDGAYFEMLDGKKVRTLSFKMALDVGSHQLSQSMATDSFVLFQTKKVTFKLIDSEGNDLEGEASYYNGGWKEFGNGETGSSMELFPESYSFRVGYQGVSIQKSQNIGTDPDVVFQTVPVAFALKSSTGVPLEGKAYFYAGGWKTFGDGSTGSTMELLPTTYPFRVKYLDAAVQKSQNVGADPNVEFNTVSVSFKLLSSEGEELDGEASFYSNGWKSFGDGATNTSMEMLPTSYTFKAGYLGAAMRKTQNVGADPNVQFQTVKVSFKLMNSFGLPLKGDAWFYSNGWKKFGDGETGSTMELLPVSYPFKVEYDGVSNKKTQDVSADAKVEFSTELVAVNLVTKIKVMGLSFKIPVWGGNVSYYANGWKDMGKTPAFKQLLPATYPIAVEFMGERQQINKSVTDDTTYVEFEIPPKLYYKALKEAFR